MVKFIEELYKNNRQYFDGVANKGQQVLNMLGVVKDYTFTKPNVDLSTDSVKALTPEEQAKLTKSQQQSYNQYKKELKSNKWKVAKTSANTAAELLVPFYSGTEEQIKAVNDYLDGSIDKNTMVKRVKSGTITNAIDGLLMLVGGAAGAAVSRRALKGLIGEARRLNRTAGRLAANKYAQFQATSIRNGLVKQNPNAAKVIKRESDNLANEMDKVLKQNGLKSKANDYLMATEKEYADLLTRPGDYETISIDDYFRLIQDVDTRSPLAQLYDLKLPATTKGTGFTSDIPGTQLVPLKDGSLIIKDSSKGKLIRVKPEIAKTWEEDIIEANAKAKADKILYIADDIPDSVASKLNKGIDDLNLNDKETILGSMKKNAKDLGDIADEVGATKEDLPKLIPFVKWFQKIYENSPNFIKSKGPKGAAIYGTIGAANTGLSLYDIFQDYKEYGEPDLAKIASAPIRIAGGFIPIGGPAMQLFFSGLGYFNGDKLARAALRRIGFNQVLSQKEKEEISQGLRSAADMSDVPEYLTGASGRRYHRVGNKIYDFSTGSMTNVNQALDDAANFYSYNTQKNNDEIAQLQQQEQQLMNAKQQGYDIPDIQFQNIQNRIGELQQQNSQNQQALEVLNISDDYNDNEPLIDQYMKREVEPQIQKQQEVQIANQQSRQQNLNEIMREIAGQQEQYINQYFTPENLAIEYSQYNNLVGAQQASYLSPEEFAEIKKQKAMYQMLPTIREKALQELTTLEQLAQKNLGLTIQNNAQAETVRNNYVKNMIDEFKAKESQRHNLQSEAIDIGNLGVNQQKANIQQNQLAINKYKADIDKMNALTQQQRAKDYGKYVETYTETAPYNRFEAMGAGFAGGMSGGVDADTMINLNPELGKQLFPSAFQQNQDNQQQTSQQPMNARQTNEQYINNLMRNINGNK